ncbi:uncharacterized protein LOC111049168 [Nilaparvata lugens]|uniref:uncharacterized protein LOC111049168 n=1 Tax=Nilaparvata lugens TaxID=108931 RepID=UPI00193E7660|nr:uncharacterized protein LOC111049168 [Nilaparvata lugens]
MLSTGCSRIIHLFVVLLASFATIDAQRRWGQGGWGQVDDFDSSITFDDDSAVGPDQSVGWAGQDQVGGAGGDQVGWAGGDQVGWNNVDNNPSFVGPPGLAFPPGGSRPNRQSTTTRRTTSRITTPSQRTTSSGGTTGATTTTARPNPQLTQCVNQCPTSIEYNPVCGSNRMTYNNPGRLRCAASCGTDVQLLHYGVCREVGAPQTFPRRDP